MNNQPVAWGWYDLEIKRFFPHWDEDLMEDKEGCIPLYTHPVKPLTDKEILDIAFCEFGSTENALEIIYFARTILKKASEE